jgi:sugar lactone lactonase YvrE
MEAEILVNNLRKMFCRATALGALVTTVSVAAPIVVPGERAYPENLSAASDGTLYIGRAGDGGIARARPDSQSEIWIAPGAFGSRSIFGVLVDELSGTLWACSNDLTSAGITAPGTGKTALKGFDLKSGGGKSSAELPGDNPFCNDIAVAPDGGVYVSEGTGRVLKLNPDARTFQIFASDPQLEDVDGIAFGADGNLYVNTYGGGGLFRIKVKGLSAGQITKLHTPRPLSHPDGMRTLTGNTFLMVEGAGNLDQVTIQGDTALLKVLKSGLREPAAVAQIGQTAWVAETQISVLFDTKTSHRPVLPFRVVAVSLASRGEDQP